ncbi:sirohydrochlorin chelatase [Pseudalkalibacillus hwajinpoensis]|uniref:sirohydrochlorin chelatase n=1 Tax=Guptibacillus hwajinpoensis TaxID=208199 RepID=UPI00325C182E
MQAVLYICHGSRVEKGRNQAVDFVEKCKSDIPFPIQETCFLELSEPTIRQGIEACVRLGATKISVIPVLLLAATHVKKDIPDQIKQAQKAFPDVAFQVGDPFGVHEKVINVLSDRVQETNVTLQSDALALLVGRGSSDPEIKQEMKRVAGMLNDRMPFKNVSVCFLAAANPSFEEGLELALSSGNSQVFVLPYLLFTGVLMGEMEQKISALNVDEEVVLCDYLGYHPYLKEVLIERVAETVQIGSRQ